MVTKRARLWVRRGATLGVSALVVTLASATWLLSSHIDSTLLAVDRPEPSYDLVIRSRTAETIRLPRTPETVREGTWGIESRAGRGQVGPVLDVSDETVLRSLVSIEGAVRRSSVVDFVPYIGADPGDRGLAHTEVLLESALGTFSAWEIPGSDDTWVIVLHGPSEGRRQALGPLPALSGAGYPVLVPTYRNHEDAPSTASGRFSLGAGERREVEAALEYAFQSGARDVVLYGYGAASTIVGELLHESPWGALVVGVILDSPMLDPGAAVDIDASSRNAPGFVIGWAKSLTTLRFGIDWSAVDQVERAGEWMIPALLLHGDTDTVAPIRASRDFAEAAPGLVTLVEVEDAIHAAVWNADPARYEEAVLRFLGDVAEGPSDLEPVDPEEVARRAERS